MNRKEDKHEVLVNMPYIVLHILLKYKALDLYIESLFSGEVYRSGYNILAVMSYCGKKQPTAWLDFAFNFYESLQGNMFWREIRAKIQKEYEKSKKLSDKHHLLVEMPYIVLHVLLRNKALDLYCNNALSVKANCFGGERYLCMTYPLVWIDAAFCWENSPEGMMFWSNIFDQVLTELINQ